MMKNRWITGCIALSLLSGSMVSLAGLQNTAGGGVSQQGSKDTDSGGAGLRQCGANCEVNGADVWMNTITCANNQTCCGWYICATNEHQELCCDPGYACNNGTQTNPPSAPGCVVNRMTPMGF